MLVLKTVIMKVDLVLYLIDAVRHPGFSPSLAKEKDLCEDDSGAKIALRKLLFEDECFATPLNHCPNCESALVWLNKKPYSSSNKVQVLYII